MPGLLSVEDALILRDYCRQSLEKLLKSTCWKPPLAAENCGWC